MAEESNAALERATNQLAHVADLRALGWGTLALGFYEPSAALAGSMLSGDLEAELRKATSWLDTGAEQFDDGLAMLRDWAVVAAERDPAAVLQDLKVEYARLFIGAPGPMDVAPYESLYRDHLPGGDLVVNGPSTLAVERTYAAHGLRRAADHSDLPDHMATELEFMHFLSSKERDAWEHGDTEAAKSLRNDQRRFLDEHLGAWLPEFCHRLAEAADSGVYTALAALLEAFLDVEGGGNYAQATLQDVFGGNGR